MLFGIPAVGYFIVCVVSGTTCILLILMTPLLKTVVHERNDADAVQASHSVDRLRLGGIGILTGVLVGSQFVQDEVAASFITAILVCAFPVVISGIFEDMGYRVTSTLRFIMALASAGLCVLTFGVWVARVDWQPLNVVFGIPVLGITLTILAAGVFSHSLNLIDGMNGLCSGAVVFMLIGFSVVGFKADVVSISIASTLTAAAVLGFFMLNWPAGLIFMGDAGAYALGHFTIWIGILLVSLVPQTAVPAILLILFYPFADTVHSIVRRVAQNHKIMEADRMHLHHKVRRGLEILWLGSDRKNISNPLTTVCLLPFVAAPVSAGVLFWNDPVRSWLALGLFSLLFAAAHSLAIVVARRLRKRPTVAPSFKRLTK